MLWEANFTAVKTLRWYTGSCSPSDVAINRVDCVSCWQTLISSLITLEIIRHNIMVTAMQSLWMNVAGTVQLDNAGLYSHVTGKNGRYLASLSLKLLCCWCSSQTVQVVEYLSVSPIPPLHSDRHYPIPRSFSTTHKISCDRADIQPRTELKVAYHPLSHPIHSTRTPTGKKGA